MISDDFNVWFVTKLINNSKLSEINKSFDLREIFEDCWNISRKAVIENWNLISKNNDDYIEIEDYEDLEWFNNELEEAVAGRDAVIETLLSRICELEQQVNDK